MAIKKDINLDSGIIVNEAYCRVENITIDKQKMNLNVRKYVAKDKPFFSEEIITCDYDIDGDNPFKQSYEYLKTLEKFKDAEDC